jgi:hypothetical protein
LRHRSCPLNCAQSVPDPRTGCQHRNACGLGEIASRFGDRPTYGSLMRTWTPTPDV